MSELTLESLAARVAELERAVEERDARRRQLIEQWASEDADQPHVREEARPVNGQRSA